MSVFDRMSRRGIAMWSIVAGAYSAVILMDGVSRTGFSQAWIAILFVLSVYGLMIAGGVGLLRNWPLGLWLVLASQMLQLPVVTNGSIAYAVMPPPSVELELFPNLGFSASTEGRLSIEWNGEDRPFQASVSGVAAVVFVWAVTQMKGDNPSRRPT